MHVLARSPGGRIQRCLRPGPVTSQSPLFPSSFRFRQCGLFFCHLRPNEDRSKCLFLPPRCSGPKGQKPNLPSLCTCPRHGDLDGCLRMNADDHTAMKLPRSQSSANSCIHGHTHALHHAWTHGISPPYPRDSGGPAGWPRPTKMRAEETHRNPSLGDAHLLHADEDGSERPVCVTREPPLGQVVSMPPQKVSPLQSFPAEQPRAQHWPQSKAGRASDMLKERDGSR